MNKLILLSIILLTTGCANDPYNPGRNLTKVSKIQDYTPPDYATCEIKRVTVDEASEICDALIGSVDARGCHSATTYTNRPRHDIFYWVNKEVLGHEFDHFTDGPEHITNSRTAKWMRAQKQKNEWRKQLADNGGE